MNKKSTQPYENRNNRFNALYRVINFIHMTIETDEREIYTELLRGTIRKAPEAIEAELARTAGKNRWIDCLRTQVSIAYNYIELMISYGELPKDKIAAVRQKCEQLLKKIQEYQAIGEGDPSNEQKTSLLDELSKICE